MGIGNSKFNSGDGEPITPKIRRALTTKLEEFKKRNNDTTLSKKQLLKDADDEDGHSHSSRKTETEDKVSPKEIQPPDEEIVVRPTTTAEKPSRVVPMPAVECEIEKNNANEGNVEQVDKDVDPNHDEVIHIVEMGEADIKTEEGKTAEPVEEQVRPKDDDNIDDNDGDDADESQKLQGLICPGSPSFRIYCIEADQGKEDECKSPTFVVHQKSRSAESVRRTKSGNLDEVVQDVEIESTPKRKGNKKKFGAVKTLLKVKSCYHPMRACTGEDRGTLVTAKATK